MTLPRSIRLIALLLLVLVLCQFAPAQEAPLNGFDDYVNKALHHWQVPGGQLKAVLSGQPVYDLTPVAPTRFRIKGASGGFFDKFEMAEGKVKSLTLAQGAGPSLVLLPKQ